MGEQHGDAAEAPPPPKGSSDAGSSEEGQGCPLSQPRFGTTGFQHAGPIAKTTYSFVDSLIKLGVRGKVRTNHVAPTYPGCASGCHRLCMAACSRIRSPYAHKISGSFAAIGTSWPALTAG
jgi:hypothetical protein